jgi:cell division cycle 20-like protein 1, cofactor of APC complex
MNFKFLAESPWKKQHSREGFASPRQRAKSPGFKSASHTDRFIPYRVNEHESSFIMDVEDRSQSENQLPQAEQDAGDEISKKCMSNTPSNYLSLLQIHVISSFQEEGLFLDENKGMPNQLVPKVNRNFLKYKKQKKNVLENSLTDYSPFKSQINKSPIPKSLRKIPKLPYKILDAPSLLDDYYLNLVDWSSSNELGIGLDSTVYIWSAKTTKAIKAYENEDGDPICSVSWNQGSNYLAIGENDGSLKIFDVESNKIVTDILIHDCRIGSLAWNDNIISSGSRDRTIQNRDIRCPNVCQFKSLGHKQEVCGLKWSPDRKFLASGGNDNKLFIWNLKTQTEMIRFGDHQAAVKALAWNPRQPSVLASGGGKSDRTIKFWNTNTLSRMDSIDTGSQVCNLVFSKNTSELVSTHGYSLNEINVWSYPTMEKVASLTGHSSRVLYLGLSPNGENIVTGAGDETLRFWHIFPPSKSSHCDIFDRSKVFPSCVDLR